MENTITVIELFNRIANKEEVPNKIKYNGEFYELSESKLGYYNAYSGADLLRKIMLDSFYLLKEIEIIEEDKTIRTVDIAWQNVFDEQAQQDCVKMILNKINEIIDKINSMED